MENTELKRLKIESDFKPIIVNGPSVDYDRNKSASVITITINPMGGIISSHPGFNS